MLDAEILELWEACQDEADERYTLEAPLGAFSDVRVGEQEGWIDREAVLMFARRLGTGVEVTASGKEPE